jgi:hypothetical protein
MEQDPLGLERIAEEILERKSSGSSLKNRYKRRQISVALTTQNPLPVKVGTSSPAAMVVQ